MTQQYDSITTALTGQLVFILLVAATLALPVSIILLKIYRRAVLKSMRTRTDTQATEPLALETSPPLNQPVRAGINLVVLDHASTITTGAEAEVLYSEALRAPWRAAAIYAVAGLCYALVMAGAFLAASKQAFLPLRFLFLFWNHAWPVILTVNLVAAVTRRAKLMTASTYFLILAAIGIVGLVISPEFTWDQIAAFWLITNLLPTALLLAFLSRGVRAVGPLVLTFMVVAITGSSVALSIAGSSEGRLRAIVKIGLALGLDAQGMFIGLKLIGFVILGLIGWLILRWIGRLYERKKISDQSITLDSLWLLFGIDHSIGLVFEGAGWILSGLCAFLVYKVVSRAGFSLLGRKANQTRKSLKLLLLRVFSLGKRSERLFDAFSTHWRHVGSIRFISGPDLATTTVEPHEFLDFLSGKLARRFIDGPRTLELRISQMDDDPDKDGRFRVNDFFCYDDTWKMALSRLASESNAVMMDLRGFSQENSGCVFEVHELINVVPLGRIVFVIDDTTNMEFLRQTALESWSRMRSDSPNRPLAFTKLCVFRFTGSHGGELKQLLRSVCVAAQTTHPTAVEF